MFNKLLIATHNPGKVREYRDLLADLPLAITWLDAEKIDLDVEETGSTFAENAILKAQAYAHLSGLLTWADDSGLEVDALDGWPGVASARHAGPDASDADRIAILLEKLKDVPFERRTAVFRCVVALATPDGRVWTAQGSSSGVILEAPRGKGGFGYDPVFLVPKFDRTYAELSPSEKHAISHRGRAAKRAREILARILLDENASSPDSVE
ncbi:MAG: RdgB/HAM1 family non-canonical purine NTP pyrophosphatase [Chloroflexi bacterium]|nr:RdgB/HAM1 family non-canonical purine NTP pyrophosphatase [Chloroflexota bacterium]